MIPTIEDIHLIVCNHYEIPLRDPLDLRCKRHTVLRARRHIVGLACEIGGVGVEDVTEYFGYRAKEAVYSVRSFYRKQVSGAGKFRVENDAIKQAIVAECEAVCA